MSSVSISFRVVWSFRDFLDKTDPSQVPSGKNHCLADFIQAWVESGHGVRACLGDFQTFLIAVSALTHYWHQEPSTLDYLPSSGGEDGDIDESSVVERRVRYIFPPHGQAADHVIFDPDFFAAHTFRELHGKQDDQ